jgi:cellulose synthase/poly-beta-1,6-N-acetylglucosamine synthase-like glycosyltransferase
MPAVKGTRRKGDVKGKAVAKTKAKARVSVQATSKTKARKPRRRQLALLLPGHNEELIIAKTIQSAVKAGQQLRDIYVVDDNSNDGTRREALKHLPKSNVLSVERSGKAGAVLKAIKHFKLEDNYTWIHIADADSIFGSDYFRIYKSRLNARKYAAAVGFVQSLRGNWLAKYRCFSYTYGQHIFRRIQGWLRMISVMPGPVSCFRSNIIKDLDFHTGSVTEDFDITLQIHRKKLGNIVFIPEAINFTQDPNTIREFCKQTYRWQRGFFQGVRRYRIGTGRQRIDASIGFVFFESLLFISQFFVILPYMLLANDVNWQMLAWLLGADSIVVLVLAILSAAAARRPSILLTLPYYYPLRLLELGIFITAFVEVILLRRFKSNVVGWGTEGRRYQLDENALRDAAQ